jgi:riboflavin kinase/FMN adenylyltransferase
MSASVALTIGNFDGVHRGHAKLIQAAREAVGNRGRVRVLTFDPHPVTVLRPDRAPARLTSIDQRTRLLRAAGADDVAVLVPTASLLERSAESFVADMVGELRFGRDRAGSTATLRDLETEHGYRTTIIEPVTVGLADQHVATVSSSMIRWLVERGRVGDARAMLDRPFSMECPVVSGDRRGRTIGMPTANLDHGDRLLPADGIYAGRARRLGGDRWHPAAISVGTKPTFGTSDRVCEAHLLDYDGPLDDYGWTIELTFERWLRDQVRYDDVEALMEQLQRDRLRVAEEVPAGAAS